VNGFHNKTIWELFHIAPKASSKKTCLATPASEVLLWICQEELAAEKSLCILWGPTVHHEVIRPTGQDGERMSWEELCGGFHLNAATIAGWFSTWKISSKIG
jgi:hypothetical protein